MVLRSRCAVCHHLAGCPSMRRGVRLERVRFRSPGCGSRVAWSPRDDPASAPIASCSLPLGLEVRDCALTSNDCSKEVCEPRTTLARRSVRGWVSAPTLLPPGCSTDRVAPSPSVAWHSVHAPADFRVFLHRRVRISRRRCHRHEISSFLGFVSPSRHFLHPRWFPRSPVGPIPRPVSSGPRPSCEGRDGRPKASVR